MYKPKPLDRVHSGARLRHLSPGRERAYSDWLKRFILFHRERHPVEMGAEEIRQFLSHLSVEGEVAASTQKVALRAPLFTGSVRSTSLTPGRHPPPRPGRRRAARSKGGDRTTREAPRARR